MKITILTLFEKVYFEYLNNSIIKRAIDKKLIDIEIINYRTFSNNKNLAVDDYQFGGGPGMVLKLQPIVAAIRYYQQPKSVIVLTSTYGKTLTQSKVKELLKNEHLILIAGHYEGFDDRIINYIDEQISIGDFILTGGELPTLVLVDSLTRLIPEVINSNSLKDESFDSELLDYQVYTKPVDFEGHLVPPVLLSGNHQKIAEFRENSRIQLTKKYRNKLYKKYLKRTKNEN